MLNSKFQILILKVTIYSEHSFPELLTLNVVYAFLSTCSNMCGISDSNCCCPLSFCIVVLRGSRWPYNSMVFQQF